MVYNTLIYEVQFIALKRNIFNPPPYTLEKTIVKAILTKKELAEIMLINKMNFNSFEHAKEHIGHSYPKFVAIFMKKSDKYFIDFFRAFDYDISLLIAGENSKFLIA